MLNGGSIMMPSSLRPSLVVVGNGMAAMRTVEELLKLAPDLYNITVFGAEPHGNYNRIMLSPVLAGEKTFSDIVLHPRSWYEEHGITLHTGDPVVEINRRTRTVVSRSGVSVNYDRLLFAVGSKPFIPAVEGHQLPGMLAFRDIKDVEAMVAAARDHQRAVVIGGGLLGLEAANGLLRQGMEVTVVHRASCLMNRQLDHYSASLLQRTLEARSLRFVLNAEIKALVGPDRVTAVRLKDGREIAADLVVMTAGVKPNIDLAQKANLRCERGILVDDTLQTFDPCIYAVGECVQHRGATFGLVAPIWEQAQVCAAHLSGAGHRRYVQKATATRLKVTGIELYSAGDFIGDAQSENLVLRDSRRGIYKRLVICQNLLLGVVLYGDTRDGPWYFDLIQNKTDISSIRNDLLFGQVVCAKSA